MMLRRSLFLVLSLLLANSYFAKPLDAGDQVKMALAKQKFLGGQVVEALNIYKEVLTKNPKDATVLHHVGECHFTLRDYDKALEIFLKAKENGDIKYHHNII